MRRNIIRYITLSYCIALRTVSFRLKKRFPTLDHLCTTGIMRTDELALFQKLDNKITANKWFLPLVWASKILTLGLEEGRIRPQTVTTLMLELGKVREKLTLILSYDWVSVPLVYTQLVTLAVYSYFVAAIFGAQWVQPERTDSYKILFSTSVGENGGKLDLAYPFFLTLQFAFFVGWLKVAETLINPFGEDDDDFELNRLIDRHIQVGYLICDPLVEKPDLLKDKFWNQVIPDQLPYTKAAEEFKREEYKGSAEVHLKIKDADKIYSDMSLYEASRMKIQLNDCENDSSTEGIYETVEDLSNESSKTRLRKANSKREEKQPRLPEKHDQLKVVATVENVKNDVIDVYSRSKKVNFMTKTVYNEDDEEFEEIECPKEEASAMLSKNKNKLNTTDEETHFV